MAIIVSIISKQLLPKLPLQLSLSSSFFLPRLLFVSSSTSRKNWFLTFVKLQQKVKNRTATLSSFPSSGSTSMNSDSDSNKNKQNNVDADNDVKIKELISGLKTEERQLLYHQLRNALLEEEWQRERQGLLERSKKKQTITKIPILSWIWRGTQQYLQTYIEKPTRSQLTNLFIYHSLPYVAFGFIDNCIMIMTGDYIEATIGTQLGLSTLGSAALGNAIADAVSIAMAYHVERFFSRLVPGPSSLTLSQFELKRTRFTIQIARVVGIACGCLLGMVPLIFL